MTAPLSTHRITRIAATLAVVTALATGATTQTRITAPSNKYSPADDVKLGREAAAQAMKELPMLNDQRVDAWVEDIGRRLVQAIPAEFQHSEFKYTFDVVNQSDINAFALPGGPMFLNRGMIEKSKTEGEMAGVMAHELSHVALRHGTAQATKGEKFQIGAIAGQILGAVVGGAAGSLIAQGSNFGLSTYFMKYSREYESQADILGAQMLARAGYNPVEMANMFKTLEAEGGSGTPQWLSDHPNPANRYQAIVNEAKALRVNGTYSTGQFAAMQAQLARDGRSYTAQEIAEGKARSNPNNGSVGTSGRTASNARVEAPSTSMQSYRPMNYLQVSVPSNWYQVNENNAVTYAPTGAYYETQNGTAFSHGVEFGVAQGGNGNLQKDTQALLNNFARSNPDLKLTAQPVRADVNGRQGLVTQLSNVSEQGRQEYIQVTTVYLRDGHMLYMIGVAPRDEANTYNSAFNRVRQTVRLND